MKQKKKVIFLHIPKTAGLSFISIIWKQFKTSEIFYINATRKDELKKLSDAKKEKINIVVGHHYYGLHENFRDDTIYITLLRNPVNRVISMYHYIKRDTKNKFHKKINSENISLKDFVQNDEIFKEVYNTQTKMIAGLSGSVNKSKVSIKTYEKAIENLDKHFIVAGLTERFNESILMMKNELNWSYPVYVKKNVTKKKEKTAEASEEIKMLITERNEYDIKLYNYVKENFGKKIDQNKKKYGKQLIILAFLNSIYKPYQITKENIKNILKKTLHK